MQQQTALAIHGRAIDDPGGCCLSWAPGRRRSLTRCTPMQMVPSFVRSLAHRNVAVYPCSRTME